MAWNFSEKTFKISNIPEEERTPLVLALLEIIQSQQERIQILKDEIAILKGLKPKPKIRPSKLEDSLRNGGKEKEKKEGKRPGSAKRSKTSKLTINKTVVIAPDNVPEGSRFKGYKEYTVQELLFETYNTCYRLEQWQTPNGEYLIGKLPDDIAGSHYGSTLISFVLYQYYHAGVTQPLILEQLLEVGINISAGKINDIITEGKERFHAEKDEILRVGLEVSRYVHVDDTGARHQGRNGYCTHIGNELFAWFESTASKARINFLELLRAGNNDYILNEDALEYMRAQKLPKFQIEKLAACTQKILIDKMQWAACLKTLGITNNRHVRIATEGALIGSVLNHGVTPSLIIMSDDAGQFNVFVHILCWVHAERTIKKHIGFNEEQREAVALMQSQIWDFYDHGKFVLMVFTCSRERMYF